jgi:hypothetical protein
LGSRDYSHRAMDLCIQELRFVGRSLK